MLEDYFGLPDDVKMKDIRPELHYQVGTTPGCIELPRSARDESCLEFVKSLGYDDKPLDFTNKDPKWRFVINIIFINSFGESAISPHLQIIPS